MTRTELYRWLEENTKNIFGYAMTRAHDRHKAEELAGERLAAVQRSRFQWRYIRLMLHPDPEEGKRFREEVDAAGVMWNEWRKLPDVVDYSKSPDKWFE